MSLSATIAPHLPFLRRFSRAVSGSQHSGDALVAAMLEAIIADVSIFPKCSNERISLYRLYSDLFTSVSIRVPQETAPTAWEQRAAANLGALAPRARQAFLLIAVEGFTNDEAAEILNASEAEFADLLAQAEHDTAAQSILITDDAAFAAAVEIAVTGQLRQLTRGETAAASWRDFGAIILVP